MLSIIEIIKKIRESNRKAQIIVYTALKNEKAICTRNGADHFYIKSEQPYLEVIEDMTKNALHILGDDATLDQFKKNALEQARQFDVDHILPQYEAVYNSVLEPVS